MTDRVLLDSNVLIAAIDSSRQGHLLARSLIESDPRALSVTGQNLREFLSALTRPTSANGYGAPGDRAVADWAEITSTMEFMDETPGSRQLLTSFVSDGKATGTQVHDANLVAVAVEHGATTLITANRCHFERFAEFIEVEELF